MGTKATGGAVGDPGMEDFNSLVACARELVEAGQRRMLGITGAPGAGKSTLAAALVAALNGGDAGDGASSGDVAATATLVAMDGFHLANSELRRLGRRDRKGAPDTFDVDGYVALLQRLKSQSEGVVYAPVFDRSIDESVGSAVAVPTHVPLVVTEGNYLLLDTTGWDRVAALLDEAWYLDVPEDSRQQRLIARHERVGLSADAARKWALGTDQRNAELVAATRSRATRVICLRELPDTTHVSMVRTSGRGIRHTKENSAQPRKRACP